MMQRLRFSIFAGMPPRAHRACCSSRLEKKAAKRTPSPRWLAFSLVLLVPLAALAQDTDSFHRAAQDREISYWLLAPETHQFRISHDFNVSRPGQKYVHSFVRSGSVVSSGSRMFDLDRGVELKTYTVKGSEVNALHYYPNPTAPDSVVVQGDLDHALGEGESVRIRVEETYTDPVGYTEKDGELVWTRTLGRPMNRVTLPAGWKLTSVNVPAVITLDGQGRVSLRFVNPRNDELNITIKAKKRS